MTSKAQFRAVFEKEAPETLKFLDGIIEEFGRKSLNNLVIYCPLRGEKYATTKYGKNQEAKRAEAVRTMVAMAE